MGAPSDQFLLLLWRPPEIMSGFFFMLCGDPLDHFFAYYIGAPRSLSLLTIWGPSDHFLLIQYGGPSQISFYACYKGGGGTSDFSFFTKYMGAPSDQFLRLLYGAPQASFFAYYMGPLRSVFVHTFWGALLS